jgi:PKD repeat protein
VASVALATVNGSTFALSPEGSHDPDGTIVKYEWDFESDGVYDFSSADGLTSHFFAGGVHSVTLRVTDNRGATATATFELTANFPPTAKIGIATSNGSDFSFSGSESSDPEGGIFMWEWDFEGDGLFEEFYFSDPGSLSHSFSGGPHQVSLRVTDGLDATDTETITVTGNYPPMAKITVDYEETDPGMLAEYTLHFNESSDVEGPLYSGFYTVNGGPAVEITDFDAPVHISVNDHYEPDIVLTVLDGLWATDTQLVHLGLQGPVFAED